MTQAEFKKWRKGLKLTQQEAADALGMSARSIANYERGRRYEDGRPVTIPKVVKLACMCITAFGLNPEMGTH